MPSSTIIAIGVCTIVGLIVFLIIFIIKVSWFGWFVPVVKPITVSSERVGQGRRQNDFHYSNVRGRTSANSIHWSQAANCCSVGSNQASEVKCVPVPLHLFL